MKSVQIHSLIVGIMLASSAQSSPTFIPSGSNLTFGHTSNTQTIHAFTNNPAMGASALKDGNGNLKWGIFNGSFGLELGDVNNIEQLIDDLSKNFDSSSVSTTNPNGDIKVIVDGFNASLSELDKNGYLKVNSNFSVASPIVIASDWLGGTLVFDINFTASLKAQALHEYIYFTDITDPNDDINYDSINNTIAINNDSSILGSVAAIGEYSVGYSRSLLSGGNSDLYGGLRIKALRVGLYREAIKLSDPNNDIYASIQDFSLNDAQSKISADAGVLYTTQHYRVGATMKNLNSPSFDYNALDLSTFTSNPFNPDYHSVYNRLNQSQSFTMDRQLILEAAWYTQSRNWVINASYDANPASDPYGDKYKWMVVSAAYASDSFFIPGLRAGMRKNMAGSKLSYLTFGTTLFNVFDLDVAYGTESVEVSGSSYPRSAYISAGVALNF